MKTLKLKNKFQTNATLISNDFIDNHMTKANGEFVKVYLFLLRHLDDPCSMLTISTIADHLNNTENDILRAFRYWEAEGLLNLEKDADGRITGLELEKAPALTDRPAGGRITGLEPEKVPALADRPADGRITGLEPEKVPALADKPAKAAALSAPRSKKAVPLTTYKAQKELKSLLFIAEQYLGKTLSKTDVDAITYFYDTLGMSADLIEYLIESCVENNHKNIHYIQKVAISWTEEGITTVEQAKQHSMSYNKNCYTVLNAFGIKNRAPAAAELAYIRKWTEDLGFSLEIIQEACSRTIAATHQPSFEYTDTILERWHQNKVRQMKDITALDAVFQKEKASKKAAARQKAVTKNMNNFERRTYDMDSLEEQLLNSN